MSDFWNLVKFEYKKILQKRSIRVAFLLMFLITIISVPGTLIGNRYVEGEVYESNYDAVVKDRGYERELSGQKIDSDLIMKTVQAYSMIPESGRYEITEEYEKFARPYSGVYRVIRNVFNTQSKRFNMEDFQLLTREEAEQFYAMRHDKVIQLVEETAMSDKAKEKVIAYDSEVQTPLTFSYIDGYTRFFVTIYTSGVLAAFVMAICMAPLFSSEYTSGADQLILSSRYGKNKVIKAKLWTGFSLAAMISLFTIVLGFVLSLAFYGADGAGSPLQLYTIMSPYPLTMWQVALFLALSTFFACIMTAAITMLLSSKLKSHFGVIILIVILLVAPMFGYVSESKIILHQLSHLLPTNMMAYWSVMSTIQYELLGMVIKPYVLFPIFAILVSMVLTPLTYRSFKKHQIQ